jgi:hypothetical protein
MKISFLKYAYVIVHVIFSLILFNSCVETGRDCENDANFIAFLKQVDEFSAISSRTECFELQQAARGILANSEGCEDRVIIDAHASGWLVIDCSKWTGLGE